jgi:tRNA(fMet)-specific endonuclease VapC
MIVLDTDHLSVLQQNSELCARLLDRIDASADRELATTIITCEEQLRGRLAGIRQRKTVFDEVSAYAQFAGVLRFYTGWTILPFDRPSAIRFDGLRRQKIRIGTMDLKIASIILTHDATLLSANLRDFQQVPGLQIEDWLRA